MDSDIPDSQVVEGDADWMDTQEASALTSSQLWSDMDWPASQECLATSFSRHKVLGKQLNSVHLQR